MLLLSSAQHLGGEYSETGDSLRGSSTRTKLCMDQSPILTLSMKRGLSPLVWFAVGLSTHTHPMLEVVTVLQNYGDF